MENNSLMEFIFLLLMAMIGVVAYRGFKKRQNVQVSGNIDNFQLERGLVALEKAIDQYRKQVVSFFLEEKRIQQGMEESRMASPWDKYGRVVVFPVFSPLAEFGKEHLSDGVFLESVQKWLELKGVNPVGNGSKTQLVKNIISNEAKAEAEAIWHDFMKSVNL